MPVAYGVDYHLREGHAEKKKWVRRRGNGWSAERPLPFSVLPGTAITALSQMRKWTEPEGEKGAWAGIDRTVGSVLRMSGNGIALRSLLRDRTS